MARSAAQCAAARSARYGEEIRSALEAGDSRRALRRSYDYLLAEAAKRRERHAGDGALVDAALAGVLWHLAGSVPDYLPRRRGRRAPAPPAADLLAAFAEAVQQGGGDAP
jgi:hypothetical protein